MNTTFSISTTDASVKMKYNIDLGADILAGMSDATVRALATRTAIIDMQNNSKLGLRACEDIDAVVAALIDKYPDVDVTIYTEKPKVSSIDKLTNEDLVALLKKRGLSDTAILELVG